MNKEEQREKLMNEFIAKYRDFASDNIDFLQLKDMAMNVTEEKDLEEIADTIAVGIGSIEQAWEDLYAFRSRVRDEKELENAEDKS